VSNYSNKKELISFLYDSAHDIEIDNDELALDLRTLAQELKDNENG
jgi:hypothetical protein